MEKNYQGDLTDIIRATGGNISGEEERISLLDDAVDWQFSANPMNYPPCGLEEKTDEEFGDPFSNRRDPLLLLHLRDPPPRPPGGATSFFSTDSFGGQGLAPDRLHHHKKITEHEKEEDDHEDDDDDDQQQKMKKISSSSSSSTSSCRPANIFSRMLQISPPPQPPPPPPQSDSSSSRSQASPRGINTSTGYPLINIPNDQMMMIGQNHLVHSNLITSKSCLIENNGGAVQISSPRNTGIKRRKSQAKKVVCIPAPAPANSRPSSGEVVPSDLWAWRKYGQKPIKGSPYPRGYYRCSSSKGCSARKQVERSRTDPNMLVITYTSEHNHPWPTQRNALAGSTRAQPTKGNVNSNSSKIRDEKSTLSSNCFLKDLEHNKKKNDRDDREDGTELLQTVKEEILDDQDRDDDDGGGDNINNKDVISVDDQVMSELGFPLESYRPALLPAAGDGGSFYSSSISTTDTSILPHVQVRNHLHGHGQHHDFFAGLGEIETDPLNLLFSTSTSEVKTSDPFTGLFDWAASTEGRDDTSNTSFGDQAKSKS